MKTHLIYMKGLQKNTEKAHLKVQVINPFDEPAFLERLIMTS